LQLSQLARGRSSVGEGEAQGPPTPGTPWKEEERRERKRKEGRKEEERRG